MGDSDEGAKGKEAEASSVDVTLIDEMLRLSPIERLRQNDRVANLAFSVLDQPVAEPRQVTACFQFTPLKAHDNFEVEFLSLIDVCPSDNTDELVVYVGANDKIIRYQSGGQNCVTTDVRPDDTLRISAGGYECDFSCGEHWDDDFLASPNDRIGHVEAAFTAADNFGAPGTYSFLSQPDTATPRSRSLSAWDYRLGVTISEQPVVP